MAQQGGLRGRPPGRGAQDPGHLRHRAGRVFPLQRRRQLQHLRIGTRGQPPRCGHQRLEPASAVAADPAVQRLPRDAHLVAERVGMGTGRRSRAPASHAAWSTAPHPGPGRSADSGTTRSPAPARGACAPPTTPEVLLSNRRPARNRCRAVALARITDHAAARQGRFVLRSLSPVVTTIPVPAADHHWPRPPPDPASPRPATRPHRSGSGSRRSRSPPRPTRHATHNPSRLGSSRPPRQRLPHPETRPEPPPAATLRGAANPAPSPPEHPGWRRSGDAQLPRHGRSTRPKSVPPHTLCATAPSPATTRG